MSVIRTKTLVSLMQKGFGYLLTIMMLSYNFWGFGKPHGLNFSIFFWVAGLPDINSCFCNAFAFFSAPDSTSLVPSISFMTSYCCDGLL